MRYKLTFAAGFAAGYVMGTKAGRKRYDTISDGVRRLIDSPAVQETAGVLQAQASGAMATAKSTVTAKLNDKVSARFGGGQLFGGHGEAGSNGHAESVPATGSSASATVDPNSAPPYPAAGYEEFGGES
jgi:membrane protease subunit (stomatin/prohibitin family)